MSAKLAPWLIATVAAACDAKSAGGVPASTVTSSPSWATSSSASSNTSAAIPPEWPPVAMQFLTPHGRWAAVDYWDPETTSPRCLVHRPCPPIAPLRACEKSIRPIEASALRSYKPATYRERVSVRGPLGLALGGVTFRACDSWPQTKHICCNGRSVEVFVGDIPNGARLVGLRCGGDESRACCDVPAFGQTVVATGTIVEEDRTSVTGRGGRWALTDPTLCTESSAVTSEPPKH
jgi:hypothetical protein